MVNFLGRELLRARSLLRSAIVFAALGAGLIGAASAPFCCGSAQAFQRGSSDNSGSGSGDGDDFDFDSSGPGNGRDDDDYEFDSSGPGNGDDDWDSSGNGGGDDDDFDSSGPGSGDDDDFDDDHSGPGSGHDFDDDNDQDRDRHNVTDDHPVGAVLDDDILYSVEYDSHGDEYVPGEIVFVGAFRDLAQARALGFDALSTQALSSGGVMARLGMPRGVSVDDGVALLRRTTPHAIVTPNNIYRSAQAFSPTVSRSSLRRTLRLRGALGVIDTGVRADSLPPDALLTHTAFAGPRPVARQHGSTVASIAISRGVRVHVADVFGHSADGQLAASAERIAAALDWMVAHRIAVVNISVEGPDNAILAEMVRRAAQRGHIIVAAAGNGGPSARPSFPAAFENVLAVTAIDVSGRPYFRANRGSYIDFAAPGVDVSVDVDGSTVRVSGTSFAAPAIAAEAAAHLQEPSPSASTRVLSQLRARAEDLGAPGYDNVFGWGALRD